jgi:hypothetical protein
LGKIKEQTLVEESQHSGDSHTVYYGINDDTSRDPITPELMAEYMRFKDMPQRPARDAERNRIRAEHPGGLVSRGFFGRSSDKSVSLQLKEAVSLLASNAFVPLPTRSDYQ